MKLIKYGFIGIFTLLLTACGGGGSGGSSAPAYNGKITPAVVDRTNDKAFTETAYGGSNAGSAFGSVEGNNSSEGTSLRRFAKSFRNYAKNFDASKLSSSSNTAAVQQYSETIEDKCGNGSQTFSGTLDDVTFEFSGSVTFNNFNDDCEGTVNGSVTMSGNFLDDSFTMTFNTLTFKSTTEDIVMNGTAAFSTVTTSPLVEKVVLNLDYQDNVKNEVFRSENLTIESTITLGVSISDEMTGKVYHPDYGYVNLITPTPVVTLDGNDYPSSGVVKMTGASGTATVTLAGNDYTVEVDEDNDTVTDITHDCTWDPDQCTQR